jgi:hypothetical protein
MKMIINILINILMFNNVYALSNIEKQDSFLFEIHFQDNFNQDIIGCKINDCMIFDYKKISSDSILGTTMLIVKGLINDKQLSIIFYGNKILCTLNNNTTLKIVITINHLEQTFVVDLTRGKYIGISKKFDNKLLLIQQDHQFEYD